MPEITRTAAKIAAMLDDGREIAFLDVHEGRLSNRRQGRKRSVNLRDGFHYSYPPLTRTFALAPWAHHNGCIRQTTFRGQCGCAGDSEICAGLHTRMLPIQATSNTRVISDQVISPSSEGGRNRA
jgi:hypothetical protein